jgi:hypothetical protein
VNVETASTLRLKTYNFPGWTASLDRQQASLLSDANGAQIVSVPPGAHTVEVYFGNTFPRTFGAVITGIGFLIVLGLALLDFRQSRRRGSPVASHVVQEKDERKWIAQSAVRAAAVWTAIIIGAVLVFVIIKPSGPADAPPPSGNLPTREADRAVKAEANDSAASPDVGRFRKELETIRVSVDEETVDELVGALALKESDKVNRLIESGEVFVVNNDANRV